MRRNRLNRRQKVGIAVAGAVVAAGAAAVVVNRPRPPTPTPSPPPIVAPAPPVASAGPNLFVSKSGSDSNPGTWERPYLTFKKAVGSLRDNGSITFRSPGTWSEGLAIARNNVTIKGEGPGVILDGRSVAYQYGIWYSGTGALTVEDLLFQNYGRHAIRIGKGNGFTLRRVTVKDCGYKGSNQLGGTFSGILTAQRGNVTAEDCLFDHNAEHGLYLGHSGDNLTIRRSRFLNNFSAGLQINAVSAYGTVSKTDPLADWLSKNCLVEDNQMLNNCSGSTNAGISLAGVRDSTFRRNIIGFNTKGAGISGWHNTRVGYGCQGNTFDQNWIVFRDGTGKTSLAFNMGNSTGNTFSNSILICYKAPALGTGNTLSNTQDYRSLAAGTGFLPQNVRQVLGL